VCAFVYLLHGLYVDLLIATFSVSLYFATFIFLACYRLLPFIVIFNSNHSNKKNKNNNTHNVRQEIVQPDGLEKCKIIRNRISIQKILKTV